MPKVTAAHKEARREEILEAAQRVFARVGYRGSSIPMIIDESGLSAGAIYSYFDGKNALFHAVVERALELKTARFALPAGAEPRSPDVLLRTILEHMQGAPILEIAPQIWAEAAVDPETRAVLARVFGRILELLRTELTAWAALRFEDADAAAWAQRVTPVLFAAIPGFILQRTVLDEFDEGAYLDALAAAYPH